MTKQFGFIVVISTLMMTNSVGIARGQATSANLKDKLITIHFKNKPLYDVFSLFINEYDIAIGFEQSMMDRDHNDYQFEVNIPYPDAGKKRADGTARHDFFMVPIIENHLITVEYDNARLEDVMNDIVKQMRNYSWSVDENIIHIFPCRGRDPQLGKLLDLKIQRFTINSGERLFDVKSNLIALDTIEEFFRENDLAPERVYKTWYGERNITTSVDFTDLFLRDLLDRIVRIKRGAWILKRSRFSGNVDLIL